METEARQISSILEIAWTRFAQLDAAAVKRSKAHLNLKRWIVILGVLATFFAISIQLYPVELPAFGKVVLKGLLILSPITASLLAAYTNKFFSSGDWLVTRAGAEEMLKNIYVYRTILQKESSRRNWMANRLKESQRSIYNGMNDELVLEPYEGIIPPSPRFDTKDPNNDPGFDDLNGDEYFKFRLEDQLAWHIMKVSDRQAEMRRLQFFILGAGGAGTILAAFGAAFEGPFILWVTLASSITLAIICWQQLHNLDIIVRNYSKVIVELQILYDHWQTLAAGEHTQSEFFKMVHSTERILGSRNMEYILSVQEVDTEDDFEEGAGLITRVIREQRESDGHTRKSFDDGMVDEARSIMDMTEAELTETFKNALASLVEEASSEIVQAEIEAMQNAIMEMEAEADKPESSSGFLASSLESIAEEFGDIDLGRDTPKDVLNEIIRRYPKTQDLKG